MKDGSERLGRPLNPISYGEIRKMGRAEGPVFLVPYYNLVSHVSWKFCGISMIQCQFMTIFLKPVGEIS